jgi:hypothetical protein
MRTLHVGMMALAVALAWQATATTIDFEGFGDQTAITSQYTASGVNFSGTVVLQQNVGLNSTFPPHSGVNVVYDYPSGTMQASAVGSLWAEAGGYITGNRVITLEAFDSGNNLLGSVATPGANYVGSGTGLPQNIFLDIVAPNITYVEFHDGGNTFTLDDFTFTPQVVPEASSAGLLLLGGALLKAGGLRRRLTR